MESDHRNDDTPARETRFHPKKVAEPTALGDRDQHLLKAAKRAA